MRDHLVLVGGTFIRRRAKPLLTWPRGRARTADVAFNLSMPAGLPGTVSRHTPPGTIEQCLMNVTTPILGFGFAVLPDLAITNGVRQVAAGDSALTNIYGIAVNPFPTNMQSATNYGATGFGATPPPTNQPIDVLRSGYILVPIVGTPQKGGQVFVWVAASGGGHTQGGFEAAATGGSTISIENDLRTTFSGGVDASGVGEVCFNI